MRNFFSIIVCLGLLLVLSSQPTAETPKETAEEQQARIHLKHTEPRTVASMLHKGPYTEIPSVIMNLITEVEKGGYNIAGPYMFVAYSSPGEVPQEELLWEIWIPVAYPGPMGSAEEDQMGFKYLDPMFVAYTFHIGPYDKVGEVYQKLFEWAGRGEYKITGPPVEIYWSSPMTVPEEKLVTEIWLPVEEKKIPGGVVK